MKKAVSLLLFITLLLTSLSLFSCGNSSDEGDLFTKNSNVENTDQPVKEESAPKVSYIRENPKIEEEPLNGNYRSGNSDYVSEDMIKKYPQITANSKIRLIRVPKAAPATPIAGAPNLPKIKTQLAPTLMKKAAMAV